MRTAKYTTRFKRDFRRKKSGKHARNLDALLMDVVSLLAEDKSLAHRHFDHALSGD